MAYKQYTLGDCYGLLIVTALGIGGTVYGGIRGAQEYGFGGAVGGAAVRGAAAIATTATTATVIMAGSSFFMPRRVSAPLVCTA